MDVAAKVFDEVSAGWGLTLSVPKTKLLVAGVGLSPDVVAPFQMNGGIVEVVKEFQYLGSLVEAAGGMTGSLNIALCGLLGPLEAFVMLCLWIVTSIWRPKDWCIVAL